MLDEKYVINVVVNELRKKADISGGIEIKLDDVDLSSYEICLIINKMRYEVQYDSERKLYIIYKVKWLQDQLGSRDALYHLLDEMRDEKYIKKHGMQLIDISGLYLDLDEIAETINKMGFCWLFEDYHSVWIL